jgi:hypothetical protein
LRSPPSLVFALFAPETKNGYTHQCARFGIQLTVTYKGDTTRRFALTPAAEFLRTDHPGSMRALALMYAEEQYQAWGNALSSIQTGAPAFDCLFGASYFQYLAEHPESAATFDAAMTGYSAEVASAVVNAYDFSESSTVVDVGWQLTTDYLRISLVCGSPKKTAPCSVTSTSSSMPMYP